MTCPLAWLALACQVMASRRTKNPRVFRPGSVNKEINRYLEGPDELIVERNGQIIGHYLPRREKKEAEIKLSFERLNQAIDRAAAESGTDRETVIDTLDPSKPFPLNRRQ